MPNQKIPKQAKRVHKGVIFDVYQWPQKMYDGSKQTFELIKRQDSVLVLATVGKKIIVIRQKQPGMPWFVSVPSGRMDKKGETPKETALRELLEETGMKPARIKLWVKKVDPSKVIHSVYIFIAQDCKKVAKPELDGGEKISVKYLSFDDFLKLSDHPEFFEGELMIQMLRARLHKKKYNEFRKALFG